MRFSTALVVTTLGFGAISAKTDAIDNAVRRLQEATCDAAIFPASIADEGKPLCQRKEASKLKPGTLEKVCRPATLPETVDPMNVDVASLGPHLVKMEHPACPSDHSLVIAHFLKPALEQCECDEYDEALIAGLPGGAHFPTDTAQLFRALPDTLCVKTDPTTATGASATASSPAGTRRPARPSAPATRASASRTAAR